MLQSQVVRVGNGLEIAEFPGLMIYLNAFYPDFYLMPDGTPVTLSGQMNHPGYFVFIVYQNAIMGMKIWQPQDAPLRVGEYEVSFSEPQNYTQLQVKTDHFQGLALLGGLLTLLGLLLAFYLLPERAWAVAEENGTWTVYGQSRKGGALFRESFDGAVKGEKL